MANCAKIMSVEVGPENLKAFRRELRASDSVEVRLHTHEHFQNVQWKRFAAHEELERRGLLRIERRFWISTIIAIVALIVSIISLLA